MAFASANNRYLLLLPALLLCIGPVYAQSGVPTLTGPVVDEAGILSPSTEAMLSGLLMAHEDSTTNQVVVLTVPSLGGMTVEAYSLQVVEAWKLGTAERDNGVLLLVAPNDREMRIEVGYGLEGDLPDVVASRIIRNELVPHFRDGDFEGGVTAGVKAVVGTLEGSYEAAEVVAFSGYEESWVEKVFVWIIMWFIWLGIVSFFSVIVFAILSVLPRIVLWILSPAVFAMYVWLGTIMSETLVGKIFGAMLFGGFAIAASIPIFKKRKTHWLLPKSTGSSSSGSSWSSGSSYSSSSSSYSSSSSSSSSSSYSGGGGSFGGGGASGSW